MLPRRRWLLLPCLVAIGAALTVTSVAAQSSAPEDRYTAYDAAVDTVARELGWLVRLDALTGSLPPGARTMPENLGLPTLARAEMVGQLRDADGRGPLVLARLEGLGEPIPGAVRQVLTALPGATMQTIETGKPTALTAKPYMDAYSVLLDRWGPLHEQFGDRLGAAAATSSGASGGTGGSRLLVEIGIGVAVAVSVTGALLWRARRADDRLAYVDALTHVANRRRFDRDLPNALQCARSDGHPVALAMVDVDNFKQLNDAYGHPAGDDVLRAVADAISASVRAHDVVYRYGGEEFCVLLTKASRREAETVAERIRAAIEATSVAIGAGATMRVTASVGVAEATDDDSRALLAQADRALYAAKHAGRNRVVAAAR